MNKKASITLPGRKTATVLVVDDEGRNLRLLEALLVPIGCNVVVARGGLEALEKAKNESPDVVLLDVMMPGMDGLEVCQKMKAEADTAAIPVIMVTALKDRESRVEGIRAGADDFLTKPVDKEELTLRVKNALYAKGLFDLVSRNYEKIQKAEEAHENQQDRIVKDLQRPLANAERELRSLADQLDPRLNGEQRKAFENIFSTLSATSVSFAAVFGELEAPPPGV